MIFVAWVSASYSKYRLLEVAIEVKTHLVCHVGFFKNSAGVSFAGHILRVNRLRVIEE